MKRGILLVLALFSLALGQSLEEKLKAAEARQKAALAEAQRIEREIMNLDARAKELSLAIRRVEGELNKAARELAALRARIKALRMEIQNLSEEEAKKAAELEKRLKELEALLDLLWRKRTSGALPAVKATSLTELLVKTRWLSALGNAEYQLALDIKAEAEYLASLRRKREALLRDLEKAKAESEAKARTLKKKKAELAGLLAQVNEHKKAKEIRLKELERAKMLLEAEIARLQKAILEERARKEAYPEELVGRLLFPVAGGALIKGFAQDDSYVEIKAPRPGAPVRAAAAGRVRAIYYYGNLGWTVLIEHSSGLFTQYANLQEPLVAMGDKVEKGEVIGYLGGGTLVKPDVLWFRVVAYVKGDFKYVDPAKYF